MNTKKPIQTKDVVSVRLYRMLFTAYLPRLITLLMVSSFVLQPIARVAASEPQDENLSAVVLPPIVEVLTNDAELPAVETAETPPAETSTTTIVEPVSEAVVTPSTTTVDSSDATSTQLVDTATTSAAEDTTEIHDVPLPEDMPQVDEDIIDDATTTATSSDPAVATLTVESDNLVQFDKNDCVAVADGSFYCQPKKAEPLKSEDGLFSYPDSDGDLEIYLKRNGELKQITFNTVDDAAPYYDAISNTIVWHRLVSERYQIMSYDIAKGIETQLTTDTVNNMEPTRAGKYTAWQRWSGDNWDIVLYDGKETTILTTTLEHDIAPHIRGSLVVWNRIGKDQAQTIEIYDIQTGEYTTITDTDGGTISNPRMVLVYESSFKNGDVVTKGYDMQTGEIADLSTTPASLPDDIPPADNTGETRALIQGKLPTKEDLEQSGSTTPKIGFDPEPEPLISTSTATSSIILSSTSTQSAPPLLVPVTTSSTDLTLDLTHSPEPTTTTDFELVIPSFSASSSTKN